VRSSLKAIASTLLLAVGCGVLTAGCFDDPDAIRMPIRLCALEGSPEAEGREPGEVDNSFGTGLFARVDAAAKIWRTEANIDFDPGVSMLVVADPYPDGFLGDIDEYTHGFEPQEVAENCADAWRSYDPQIKGLTVINARKFVNAGLTFGVTPGVQSPLRWSGSRAEDFCASPRHLSVADVAHSNWTILWDEALLPSYEHPAQILAHEIGHMLMLAHGNGLDDNHDGLEPPDGEGSRRFDADCDPLGLKEDDATPITTCEESNSLMARMTTSCTHLQPLQVELAREVAHKVPGVSVGGVFLDND
jgi:hypothetical protein